MELLFSLLLAGNFAFSSLYEKEIPSLENFEVSPPPEKVSVNLDISAKSVIIMETKTGGIVFEKNAYEQRAIASITKLMTALLMLENHELTETVHTPLAATKVAGGRMKLLAGEQVLLSDLLRGLLIRSGNDAAIALAFHHSGTEGDFVKKMNQKAHIFGFQNTSFANSHGLDHPDGYSTAHEVALLARKILNYDFVRRQVRTKKTVVTDLTGKFAHELRATNMLLGTVFPVYGLKTGTTDEAGQCFVGLTKVEEKEYLMVVLGSEDRFQDTKGLIWAIENRKIEN